MIKLIEVTAHADLVERIVGQFAFMILTADEEDGNFLQLQELNLQDVFRKADAYFVNVTDDLGMITTEEVGLEEMIKKFLAQWNQVVDVTAIQQNIHYQLSVLDRDVELNTTEKRNVFNEGYSLGLKTGKKQ